ncbi:hypothetical protein EG329_006771 [Mollisiaceae sp. DMI_Dod_QoI]|nr:hypothetical protein EG329_006771 [Helotiales sp. DMI_Dod_QoI]
MQPPTFPAPFFQLQPLSLRQPHTNIIENNHCPVSAWAFASRDGFFFFFFFFFFFRLQAPANAPSDVSVSAPIRVEIRPEGDELLPDGYPFESFDEQQIDILFMQPSISFPEATVRIHTSFAAFALKYPAVAISPMGFLAVFMTEYNFLVLIEQFWIDAYAIFLFVSAQVMRALAGPQPPAFHIHIKSIFFACRRVVRGARIHGRKKLPSTINKL